jgi:hypothetical protein
MCPQSSHHLDHDKARAEKGGHIQSIQDVAALPSVFNVFGCMKTGILVLVVVLVWILVILVIVVTGIIIVMMIMTVIVRHP